jgi:hypothetical protein
MTRNQVQKHAYTSLMCFTEKSGKIFICPITRGNLLIVTYIIARILHGRIEAGVEPECIHSQGGDIRELLDDTLDITNSIPVRIIVALGVNLIKYSII